MGMYGNLVGSPMSETRAARHSGAPFETDAASAADDVNPDTVAPGWHYVSIATLYRRFFAIKHH